MTGIRVRCLDHRGQTEHRGIVLGVTQDGHDTLVVVLCDDGEARVVHYRRIRAEQTQPQPPNMLQPITPLTMIGPGLWERPDPQNPNTGLGAIIGQWPGDETEEQIAEALDRLS